MPGSTFCEEAMARSENEFKEKFRPTDKLDEQVDAELGDLSLDALYGFDKPQAPAKPQQAVKGAKRGRIMSIDAKNDEVFVDFGSKSEGVAKLSEFEQEPKIGD